MEDSESVKAAMASLQLVEGGADPGHEQGASGGQPGEGLDDPEPKRGDTAVTKLCTLNCLPDKILHHIMSYLSPHELVEVKLAFIPSDRLQEAVDVALSLCRRLRMFSLYPDTELEHLVRNLPNLRSLELANKRERGKSFSLLPSSLETLIMARSRDLDSCSLRGVAQCSRLRVLALCGMQYLNAEDLAAVVAGCPQLERLSLARSGVEADTMRELTLCASLRELDVSRCRYVEEADIAAVVSACPRLELLTMERMNWLKPERCLPPGGATSIRYLNISRNDGATSDTLRELPALVPGLQTLVMRGCRNVTASGLRSLRLFLELEVLDIRSMRCVKDAALKLLDGCQIRELRIQPVSRYCTMKGITRFVLSCPSLTSLKVESGWYGQITEDGLNDLMRQVPPNRHFALAVPAKPWGLKRLEEASTDQRRLEIISDDDCYDGSESDSSADSYYDDWSD